MHDSPTAQIKSPEANPASPLDRAIEAVGSMSALARGLGLSPKAVRKWKLAGRLPRTEYTGETDYSGRIEQMAGGVVRRDELLALRPTNGLRPLIDVAAPAAEEATHG